jgi:2-dehydropantoate 2-reductase
MAVKAWQVREIGKGLNSLLKSDTLILPLQNGISAADELSELIDHKHIIGGLCRIISKIKSTGIISHFGMEPEIVFGELDHSLSDRVSILKAVFDAAGIKSHISIDIQADLWKKFIAICVSGLLAVSKTTYGELRDLKETRVLMVELLNEIYQLSQKAGINIDLDFVSRTVSLIDSFPYDSTSSLTRDVWEGRPSEIEYQNGTVVKLAGKHGIDVPVNRFVYHCILPMELKARNR